MGNFLGFGRGDNAVRGLQYTTMDLPGQAPQSAADRTHLLPHIGTNLDRVFADPTAQAYLATMQRYGVESRQGSQARDALNSRMRQLGASLPPHSNWAVGPNGTIGYQQADINNDYVYPIATLAAAGGLGLGVASAAGAFSGGAAGAGGGGAAAGGGGAAAGGGGAAAGGGGAAAGGGGAAGASGWGAALSAGGEAASGAVQGRAAHRAEENQAAMSEFEAGLASRAFDQERRRQLTQEALRGAFLRSVTDASVTPPSRISVPTMTGGIRPSALTNRETVGADLQDKATRNLLASQPASAAPELHLERPSGVDTALGFASLAGGAYDAYRSYRGAGSTGGTSQGANVASPNLLARSGASFLPPADNGGAYGVAATPAQPNLLTSSGASFSPYARPYQNYRPQVSFY